MANFFCFICFLFYLCSFLFYFVFFFFKYRVNPHEMSLDELDIALKKKMVEKMGRRVSDLSV